ncbi:Gram-positive signal peptide protein, YSIRK family [Neisseria cinerea ATCC 14685]|uniref:Gram-positive signal peptide protein, YSIRK family n=1 Tax=Neisseria cinerea ATCC 14685 TaxID=546262 RepID=D0W334_NEICI|nr:Gram-positive signal peptide protein, YSIRK family [Neisseria cinerea ATCC 14685]
MRGKQLHFFFKVFDIGIGAALVFGNDFIAAAVVADGIAKGDVNVKGERFI